MSFLAFQGSIISRKAHLPPPWLLTAGTHNVRAVETLAALSFLDSPVTPLGKDFLGQSSCLVAFPQPESMKICNDNFGLAQIIHELGRQNIPLPVIVLRVIGQKHPQAVLDRNPRGND